MHRVTPHLEAVIAIPRHVGSGQCPKVKPVMGFLKPLSTPGRGGKAQEVQGRTYILNEFQMGRGVAWLRQSFLFCGW